MRFIWWLMTKTPMVQTAEQGSYPEVMCAAEESLTEQRALYGPTGRMEAVGPVGKGTLNAHAYDKAVMSRLNTTPELWLRDEHGQERRYQGELSGAAQPGHDVAVITRRLNGRPVTFVNFTTGIVHDSDEPTVSTSFGSTLFGAFGLSFLLALPGALVWRRS